MENQPVRINVSPENDRRESNFVQRRFAPERAPRRPSENRTETPPEKNRYNLLIKGLDRVIGISIVALFFGLPIFFTGITFQGIFFEKQLYFYFWILLALVAWVGKGVILGELNIRRTPLDFPIIGFWLVVLAGTFFSIDRWHSFWGAFADPSRGFMSVTAMVLAYYIIVSNFTRKRADYIIGAVVASGFFVSIWSILGILGVNFLPQNLAGYAPLSLLGSMTGMAIFFSALIPVTILAILRLAESGLKKSYRILFQSFSLATSVSSLFMLLAIYDFIPWPGIFVGITLMLIFILSQVVRPRSNWAWLPMAAFVMVMILKMIEAFPIAKVNLPAEASFPYGMSADLAWSALKEKPFLGSGPATYGQAFSLHRPESFNNDIFFELRFFQGKGIVMESLPTLGGIGAIALVILLLSFLSVSIYLISREKEKNKLLSLGILSAALVFFTAAVFYRVEGTILLLTGIFCALAMASILSESDGEKSFLSLSLKASPKYALALAFVFMIVSAGVAFLFVFLGKVFIADAYAGRAAVSVDREISVSRMGQAMRLYPQEGRYHLLMSQYFMALANSEALKNKDEADTQKIVAYINASIQRGIQGENLLKNDVTAVEVLAQIYENAGLYRPESMPLALEKYERALELEPKNPRFWEKKGQIKVNMAASTDDLEKRKELVSEAKAMFEKSIELKEDFADGYYQLSLALEALGEVDKAVEKGIKAFKSNPNRSDYILSLGRIYQNKGGEEDLKKAEELFKFASNQNDKNINAQFYLGLYYEKVGKKQEAKDQYRKVVDLLEGPNNGDTRSKVQQMISNVDAGIANTPETLGLVSSRQQEPSQSQQQSQSPQVPQNQNVPTLRDREEAETPEETPAGPPSENRE